MARSGQREDGFTLIELLVVIVILGVLAGVVIFAVGGITDKGESSAAKADRLTLVHAEEAFYANTIAVGKYASEAGLVGKYISEASTMHDVCLTANQKSYAIINVGGSCPSGMTLAP